MIAKKLALAAAVATLSAGIVYAQAARDSINIVGSSTVFPFATAVAERFGKTASFKAPKVESTGTGGGIKLFCSGVGPQFPDIVNASRKIKSSEVETCAKNGVTEIVEVEVGYDGIALANSKKAKHYNFTIKDIWLALAREVPDSKDPAKLIANPYRNWKDIDPNLPDSKIEVLGPPPTSGTRDAFVELVMDHGCKEFPTIAALEKSDPKAFKATCQTIREDGAYIEAGENDNLIVQKLVANPAAVGIFGFSFLEQNMDKLQGSHIANQQPTAENIASGAYPVSRPLFFYVKKQHVGVIPGIKEYIAAFMDEKAIGPEGYLADKGLIPLPNAVRAKERAAAVSLKPLEVSATQ